MPGDCARLEHVSLGVHIVLVHRLDQLLELKALGRLEERGVVLRLRQLSHRQTLRAIGQAFRQAIGQSFKQAICQSFRQTIGQALTQAIVQ